MISVIICSIDEQKFTAALGMYARLLDGTAFEIIHIPDAKGLAEGYNRGLGISHGQTVIFCHDDIEIHCDNFFERVRGHMAHCDLLGVAGTDRLCDGDWTLAGPPHLYGQIIHSRIDPGAFRILIYSAPKRRIDGMHALDGVWMCARREVAESIRFDPETFSGYHMYDLDFSFRAFLGGHRLAIAADLDMVHLAVSKYDTVWSEQAALFRTRHAGSLASRPRKVSHMGYVVTPTLEESLAVMRPGHWGS